MPDPLPLPSVYLEKKGTILAKLSNHILSELTKRHLYSTRNSRHNLGN